MGYLYKKKKTFKTSDRQTCEIGKLELNINLQKPHVLC